VAAAAARVRAEGITVDTRVYADEAAEAITWAAAAEQAALIVMSTHGRSGVGRWIYGSVADQVLRRAAVPVLLVPPRSEHAWSDARPGLRVLVPLDGSPLAEEALGALANPLAAVAPTLVLLQVVQPLLPVVADGIVYTSPFDEEVEVGSARDYLEAVATRLRADGRTVELHALLGYPTTAIAAAVREYRIDLIAMATHGREGVARLVLGSVTAGVMQQSPVPLLLVRPAVGSKPVAVPAAAARPAPDTVTITLTPRELAWVERGLAELLRGAERESGARVDETPAAEAIAALAQRLSVQTAGPAPVANGTARLAPGPPRPG
jgi:nucleotide-binding universal stress UspA family protein